MFRPVTPSRVAPDGGSHYSRPLHLKWCVRCAADVPSAGGRMRGPMFICALHHAAPKLAARPEATDTPEAPPPPASTFHAAPRHALDMWLRPRAEE